MKTLYRILAPILGVCSLCSLYFLPLFHVAVSSSLTENLMGSIGLKEYYSLHTLVTLITGNSDTQNSIIKSLVQTVTDEDSTIGAMFTNKGWFVAFAVFFVLTVVLIITMSVVSAVSKKTIIGTGFGLGALISALIMNKMFDCFASPFLSGKIGITSLLSSASAKSSSISSLSSLLSSVVSMSVFELSIAYSFTVFALMAVLILALCAIFEKKYEKNS